MPRSSPYRSEVTAEERGVLEARARKSTSPYRDGMRAKIVRLAAAGLANAGIAARLDTRRQRVSQGRHRFGLFRLPGLEAPSRGGRPARFAPQRRGRDHGPGR